METPPFQGVIGDDWRDSTPWWPEVPRPPAGAPNVVLVVLDDVGFAQLGCYGSDIATPTIDAPGRAGGAPHQLPHHRAVLADPGLPADRAQPPPQRPGPGRRPGRRVSRATTARSPRRTASCPRSSASRATPPTRWASGTSPPTTRPTWPRPGTAWPLARGFDRWYGFHGGETHQFVPALYHDNHSIPPPRTDRGGLPPERRPGRPGHRPARPTFGRSTSTAASSSTSAPAPAIRPITPPAAWIDRYRGRFDKGWDRWREETFARQLETGLLAPGTEMAPRPPWVPAWEDLPVRGAAGGRPVHGVLRRLPLLHRRPAGPGPRIPRADRRPGEHAGHPGVRQRGQLGGRPLRVDQRQPAPELRPGGPRRAVPPHRRARWPQRPQQLPLGLDHGRQHARSSDGSGRSTRAGWPIRAS